MARDIEEFLRRAAERRKQREGQGGQPAQQPKPTPPPKPILAEEIPVEIIQKPRKQRVQKRKSITPTSPQPPVNHPPTSSVNQPVRSKIDTSRIAQHADQLSDRFANVHDQAETRIHKNLDHDLTKIDDAPTITDDPSPPIFGAKSSVAADGLRKILSDPKSVGQAILVAEILKRPDFD